MTIVGRPAPEFTLESASDGEISQRALADFAGRWLVLIFYPADFGYVAATELLAFSDRLGELDDRLTEVAAINTDSVFSHLAWMDHPRSQGGVEGLRFPLLADTNHAACDAYGLLNQDGFAMPGTVIVDPNGLIQHCVVNNVGVGRCVDPILQVLDAIKFGQDEDLVVPAGWMPGQGGIIPDWRESKVYFEAASKATEQGAAQYGELDGESAEYGESSGFAYGAQAGR